jgi:hypothetical protein
MELRATGCSQYAIAEYLYIQRKRSAVRYVRVAFQNKGSPAGRPFVSRKIRSICNNAGMRMSERRPVIHGRV